MFFKKKLNWIKSKQSVSDNEHNFCLEQLLYGNVGNVIKPDHVSVPNLGHFDSVLFVLADQTVLNKSPAFRRPVNACFPSLAVQPEINFEFKKFLLENIFIQLITCLANNNII